MEDAAAGALGGGLNEEEYTHHPDLYFPDGDIILAVANDGNTTLLRLHRFLLTHYSTVFKDMFAFPSNPQINEIYEGAPIVRMSDAYDDLVGLVNALYNPERVAWLSIFLSHYNMKAGQ